MIIGSDGAIVTNDHVIEGAVGGGYIGQQSGGIGIGFAIPASTAITIANQLLAR